MLLRLKAAGERDLINRIKVLAPIVQGKDTALVLDGQAEIAARAGADGAHLAGSKRSLAAVESLKPARIAGCGGLKSRDDAMTAGERGADYVMFGETEGRRPSPVVRGDHRAHRVVGRAVHDPLRRICRRPRERSAPLVAAGADFIAVGGGLWDDPRGVASPHLPSVAAGPCGAGDGGMNGNRSDLAAILTAWLAIPAPAQLGSATSRAGATPSHRRGRTGSSPTPNTSAAAMSPLSRRRRGGSRRKAIPRR